MFTWMDNGPGKSSLLSPDPNRNPILQGDRGWLPLAISPNSIPRKGFTRKGNGPNKTHTSRTALTNIDLWWEIGDGYRSSYH